MSKPTLTHAEAAAAIQPHLDIDASEWLHDTRRAKRRGTKDRVAPPVPLHRNGRVLYRRDDISAVVANLETLALPKRRRTAHATPPGASTPTMKLMSDKVLIEIDGNSVCMSPAEARRFANDLAFAAVLAEHAA